MKVETKTTVSTKVEFTTDELKFLIDMTQNEMPDLIEPEHTRKIRMDIWVMAMRGLGNNVNDDGSMPR